MERHKHKPCSKAEALRPSRITRADRRSPGRPRTPSRRDTKRKGREAEFSRPFVGVVLLSGFAQQALVQVGHDAVAVSKNSAHGAVVFLVGVSDQKIARLDVERNAEAWKAQRPTSIRTCRCQARQGCRHIVTVLVREEANVLVERDGAEGLGTGGQVVTILLVPRLKHL